MAATFAAALTLVHCAAEQQPPTGTPLRPSPPAPVATSAPQTTPPSTPSPAPATVHPVTVAELGASWRPDCPVGPDRLRRVDLDFVGFDGNTHRGQIVVLDDLVPQVITIFQRLYDLRYPIERMRPPAEYPNADDDLSMADNNTSAFNCRGIPGSTRWSEHAYGRAIDLNPRLNPYIRGDVVQPSNGTEFVDRNRTDPGMLHDGDPAVDVFLEAGWAWGGYWRSPIDYQHFERPAG